ncbi:MAG: nucleoside-diphosphate kinase [Candidatus Pacebacteria bacterium]|nr:nucleoside-diphosphate kinase [Candidatus Paceibacterota bacterium]MDD3548490.1 nucleoside-diphosphate kinase [Candidatus Paceibacterota bacterium]MDD4999177.1 nucleoside-diphosphate kinase [Candidatus Paceibacterota bacterium]MDD5545245.1 nucleoside-diphosphate kinase [Candidatus Paceibacterota bacterium]
MNPKEEKTLVLIKPDGVKRGLIGEIIHRFEQRGLKVIALKMVRANENQIDEHYPKDEKWIKRLGEKTLASYEKYGYDPIKEMGTNDPEKIGLEVRKWLINYMISGPLIKMVVQGIHAIDMVRKIVGPTLPVNAEMGTIRGDFSVDSPDAANREKRAIHNIVHASETPEEAEHEIIFWFSPEEIYEYKRAEEDMMF